MRWQREGDREGSLMLVSAGVREPGLTDNRSTWGILRSAHSTWSGFFSGRGFRGLGVQSV